MPPSKTGSAPSTAVHPHSRAMTKPETSSELDRKQRQWGSTSYRDYREIPSGKELYRLTERFESEVAGANLREDFRSQAAQ